jgi:hypothetical protein
LRETLIENLLVAEFRNKQAARLSRGSVRIRNSRSWPVASSTIEGLLRISPTRPYTGLPSPLHIAEEQRCDHTYLSAHQIARQCRKPLVVTLRPKIFDRDCVRRFCPHRSPARSGPIRVGSMVTTPGTSLLPNLRRRKLSSVRPASAPPRLHIAVGTRALGILPHHHEVKREPLLDKVTLPAVIIDTTSYNAWLALVEQRNCPEWSEPLTDQLELSAFRANSGETASGRARR